MSKPNAHRREFLKFPAASPLLAIAGRLAAEKTLGADAVCIGRPYIWGLAAFGQAGVEKVLEMLRGELRMVMGQVGAPSVKAISADHIGMRKPA